MACKKEFHSARLQFRVGQPDSVETNLPDGSYTLPGVDENDLLISLNVVNDSLECYLDGSILPRNDLNQVSYDVTYNTSQTLTSFYVGEANQGLPEGWLIIVRLNYITNS